MVLGEMVCTKKTTICQAVLRGPVLLTLWYLPDISRLFDPCSKSSLQRSYTSLFFLVLQMRKLSTIRLSGKVSQNPKIIPPPPPVFFLFLQDTGAGSSRRVHFKQFQILRETHQKHVSLHTKSSQASELLTIVHMYTVQYTCTHFSCTA